MKDQTPTITIYTTCRNEANYLADTLDSIFSQTFEDFEITLADGGSTDGTLDILRDYGRDPRLRWSSAPDEGPGDGFDRALRAATGRYIMCLPVSDAYLSRTWFARCVAELERDPTASMIHGNVLRMHEDGTLLDPLHTSWSEAPPPSGQDYFAYWLATYMHASEITCCFRREVYRAAYPAYPRGIGGGHEFQDPITDADWARFGPHLKCVLDFHRQGYLATYLPVMATAMRENLDNLTTVRKRYIMVEAKRYVAEIDAYRDAVLDGRSRHVFKDGSGAPIGDADPGWLAGRVAHYRATARKMWDAIDERNDYHRERASRFRRKWAEWSAAFPPPCPVAIYAGGMHTQQLLEILGEDARRLNVVAIVDQRPCQGESIRGIPIFSRSDFDFSSVEHVVISSKAHEETIYRELLDRLPADRVHRLYRD
jgi:glycosyltransferase involved in cell wall biosynthesis